MIDNKPLVLLFLSDKEMKGSDETSIRNADLIGVVTGKFVRVAKNRSGVTSTVTNEEWIAMHEALES